MRFRQSTPISVLNRAARFPRESSSWREIEKRKEGERRENRHGRLDFINESRLSANRLDRIAIASVKIGITGELKLTETRIRISDTIDSISRAQRREKDYSVNNR